MTVFHIGWRTPNDDVLADNAIHDFMLILIEDGIASAQDLMIFCGVMGGQVAIRAGWVMRRSIGIETKGGKFTKLIERGSALPATCSENFTTRDINQTSIRINVFRGDHGRAVRNTDLGVFEVSGIAPGPPRLPQIEITFSEDPSECLTVSARDLGTGADLPVRRI